MPDKKERDMWRAFLDGKPESDWNPPRKPKKQNPNAKKPQTYNSGLCSWPDNSSQGPPQESWQNNDEGEVEHVLRVDPAESLPSPVGTPLSSDSFESVGQLPSSSCLAPIKPALEPREPTTRILKMIDEVRSFPLYGHYKVNDLSFSGWPFIYSYTSRTGSTSIFRLQIPLIFQQSHMPDGFFLCYLELTITSLQTTCIFCGI
jgi:hypothetical protein